MNRICRALALAAAIVLAYSAPAVAQFTLLHSFEDDTASNGSYPEGSLIQSGSTLYGMTGSGGANGDGAIFQIGTDGTDFSLLHSFGAAGDGRTPLGTLMQSGSTLYGTTTGGGSSGRGTIFQIGADGTGYNVLHSFAGGVSGGQTPSGALVQSGSTLYGMTTRGGSDGLGTIFKIGADGTGFSLLHSFTGSASDGDRPDGYASLLLFGSTLYGMTTRGGNDAAGTIFKIGTDGTGFGLLHSFTGGASDGAIPTGALIQSGPTFYGMTPNGGSNGDGTIFKINSDGTGFGLLHSFDEDTEGGVPLGSLILSGSTLYGMTEYGYGGAPDDATVFQIGTDGTGFDLLHILTGGTSDGDYAFGSLIKSGSNLYGMTFEGGTNDAGTIFSLVAPVVPEPSSYALAIVGSALILWRRRNKRNFGRNAA
jgi:uncharacterized repeat protein (TIGR03803 family)